MTDDTPTPETPTKPGDSIANGIGAAIVLTIGLTLLVAVACGALWTCRHLIAWALS